MTPVPAVPVTPATSDGRDGAPDGRHRAEGPRIRVLIADDHPVVRQGLRVLLEVQDDIDVIGEAPDGTEAARMAAELGPDVMLLDLKMPGMKGTEVIEDLAARRIRVRILVLTSVTDPDAAGVAVRAGAAGFLYKDVDPDALVRGDPFGSRRPPAAVARGGRHAHPPRRGPRRGRRPRRADRPRARGARPHHQGQVVPGDRARPERSREDGEDAWQFRAGQTGGGGPHAGGASTRSRTGAIAAGALEDGVYPPG